MLNAGSAIPSALARLMISPLDFTQKLLPGLQAFRGIIGRRRTTFKPIS
jgi:hypothetical protein